MSEKIIDKEKILREEMNHPYCGLTYFDFLDEEEKLMIYNAMQRYANETIESLHKQLNNF